jgi:acyl carrier protein
MNPTQPTSERTDEEAVFADVRGMLLTILDEYGDEDLEIGMNTTFNRDLDLVSIDMVTLAGLLQERYGDRNDFAEFLADMEFEEIIELTVGRLVQHIVANLNAAKAS